MKTTASTSPQEGLTLIAPYIAALLINLALRYDEGLSAKREIVRDISRDRFKLTVDDATVDEAIEILRQCGIAVVSRDQFAGEFVAIKKNSFQQFLDRVQRDLDHYDAIVRQAPDENTGISHAESRSYPALELLNQYEPIKSYSRFGEPWIEEVLERLRKKDPIEALSEGLPISSAAWTGIEKRMSPGKLRDIRQRVDALRAAINQSELSEREKNNAVRRVDAVERLLEAPDPPWKVVVALLTDPVFTAFLNVSAILSLIFG